MTSVQAEERAIRHTKRGTSDLPYIGWLRLGTQKVTLPLLLWPSRKRLFIDKWFRYQNTTPAKSMDKRVVSYSVKSCLTSTQVVPVFFMGS